MRKRHPRDDESLQGQWKPRRKTETQEIAPSPGGVQNAKPGDAERGDREPEVSLVTGRGSPPAPSPVLTEFRVPMAAPAQLLQIALQHVREEVAGAELHRVPAQSLADLRHRDPQQRPGVTLAHPAAWTPPQPSLPLLSSPAA